MNKDLQLLYCMKNGADINVNESAKINMTLSTTNIDDIPDDQLDNVKEYLITALNMNSVEPNIINNLEKLLEEIEEVPPEGSALDTRQK